MTERVLVRGLATPRDLAVACDELSVAWGEKFVLMAYNPTEARTPESLDQNMRGGDSGDATSKASAEQNFPRTGSQRFKVFLAVLSAGDMGVTSDEIAAREQMRLYSVKPRLTELRKYGAVVKQGTRKTVTNSESDIYVVTPMGLGEARARDLI